MHDSQVGEQSYFLVVCYRATDISVCEAAELTAYNALCEITVLNIGLMDIFAYHYTKEEFSAGFTKTEYQRMEKVSKDVSD